MLTSALQLSPGECAGEIVTDNRAELNGTIPSRGLISGLVD
jgi:hypothetical protein